MIDAGRDIFDRVARAVMDAVPGCIVLGEATAVAPGFPNVTIEETLNSEVQWASDSSGAENVNEIVYTVNAYSTHPDDPKGEAYAVMGAVDDAFRRMNAVRNAMFPLQNLPDPSIYRLAARYRVLVDKNGNLYRS